MWQDKYSTFEFSIFDWWVIHKNFSRVIFPQKFNLLTISRDNFDPLLNNREIWRQSPMIQICFGDGVGIERSRKFHRNRNSVSNLNCIGTGTRILGLKVYRNQNLNQNFQSVMKVNISTFSSSPNFLLDLTRKRIPHFPKFFIPQTTNFAQ